jgi:hypothetical protein
MVLDRVRTGAVLIGLLSVSANGCRVFEKQELVGTYRADYGYGIEQLTIRSDGTYRQDFGETGQPPHQVNEGRWEIRNRDGDFWDPQMLELQDALLVDFAGHRRDPPARALWAIPIRRGWTGRMKLPIFEDIGLEFEKLP